MDTPTVDAWSEERLRLVLVTGIVGLLILAAGLVLTAVRVLESARASNQVEHAQAEHPVDADGLRGEHYRAEVAAAPMLETTEDDMSPSKPALRQPATLTLPDLTEVGPAGVRTTAAHTPEAAVAQLAAITVSTLAEMSLAEAATIYDAWSVDPARFEQWPLALAIQSFHASAGTTDGDPQIGVRSVPVGAQIKATDGPDWVVACVQLDLTIVYREQTRFGYGHCERMIWSHDRWQIDAGNPPAPAPSTWPASERSVTAGWLPIDTGEDH